MKNGGDKVTKRRLNKRKVGRWTKLVLRSCLISIFVILISLFAIMAVCYVESLYNEKNGKDKNPLLNAYVVVTESMTPTIKVNDAIVVSRVKDNSVKIGDVITFSSADKYYSGLTVTHRVIGKELNESGNYTYRTKGDNNLVADTSLVNGNKIYGKVLFKIPKIGYIYNFISSPSGFIFSIVLPVLLVIAYECFRIYRVIKQRYYEIEIL